MKVEAMVEKEEEAGQVGWGNSPCLLNRQSSAGSNINYVMVSVIINRGFSVGSLKHFDRLEAMAVHRSVSSQKNDDPSSQLPSSLLFFLPQPYFG